MSGFFLGQLMSVGFNFAPRNFAQCNGQLLSIQQNTALFALIGTFYGGNGIQNFALPNLQGRAAISSGNGPGLSAYTLGQTGGSENHTLTTNEMPSHTHTVKATTAAASSPVANANIFANSPMYLANPPDSPLLNAAVVGASTGGQPHTNQQPYLVINWVIALQGIFPSRN